MNISLGDLEKHKFSTVSFRVWEHIKQLEIMKSQKNNAVPLVNLKKNQNYTSTLFFFFLVFISVSKIIQNRFILDANFLGWWMYLEQVMQYFFFFFFPLVSQWLGKCWKLIQCVISLSSSIDSISLWQMDYSTRPLWMLLMFSVLARSWDEVELLCLLLLLINETD